MFAIYSNTLLPILSCTMYNLDERFFDAMHVV